MSSVCISKCVDDTTRRVPARATYVNLYKWPESDAEFVKTVAESNVRRERAGGGGKGGPPENHYYPRVVDSVSCRQLYLRSYTFSRKESVPDRTKKCLFRVKERMACGVGGSMRRRRWRRSRCVVVVARRVRDSSYAALCGIFHRLLSCTASVDVVVGP